MTPVARLVRDVRRRLRDVGRILLGPRADGTRRSIGALISELRDYGAVARPNASQDLEAIAPATERLLAIHPDLWVPNILAASWFARIGEPSRSLVAVRRLRSLSDSQGLRTREHGIEQRLLEMDPGWLPTVAVEATRTPPRHAGVVMHLLKASLPDRQSGYTIRSHEILRAQVEAGLEPFVVTPYGFPPRSSRPRVPSLEVVEGIRHYRLAPGSQVHLSGPDELSRTATLAVTVVRRERPAIIHAASGHRGYENALVALALKQHLGIPMVYEVRGFLEATWTGPDSFALAEQAELTRRRMAAEARVMAAADAIVTLGTAMRDELVARGLPAARIMVAPNGVDPEEFRPIPADAELRRRYGLEGRWVFGYISNIDHPREGHSLLIEATARLVAAGRSVTCLLVGDGTLRPQLEEAVLKAGLSSSVIFTGRLPHDRIQEHYALLDAFVVARLEDRASRFVTPLKPYEAMAMGIPLIVSDLPALTEIAAPGERGLAFPLGDAEALVATLDQLIENPEMGRRLAAAAREWVVAERTWRSNGPRYAELYRSIIEGATEGIAPIPPVASSTGDPGALIAAAPEELPLPPAESRSA